MTFKHLDCLRLASPSPSSSTNVNYRAIAARCIRCCLAILGVMVLSPSVGNCQPDVRWPTLQSGGFAIYPSLLDETKKVVNVPHLIAEQFLWNEVAPQFALIPMKLEQAREIERYVDERLAFYMEASDRVDRVRESGDEAAIQKAREHFEFLREIHRETHQSGFKVKLNEVFDEEQLSMLKSMCVDAAIQHWGIEPLLREAVQNSEHKITRDEYLKLEEKLREIEFEMRRQVIQLRKKAWDDMMEALPPAMRSELEVRLNIDGIGKSNPSK